MNIRHTAILLFALPVTALAQKEDDQIGNEVVNVVKPYTPTISDAFKVKETPPVEDPDNVRKTDVKYNIFSYPVASTFTPSKGRAASVDKTPQESLYRNFATVGIGNYGTAMAELFVTADVGENSYVGGMFRHLSSQGGIEEVELEDSFHNTSLDLTYGMRGNTFSWNVDAGYQLQGYNWYGLPENFGEILSDEARRDLINSIEPQHSFHNAYAAGKLSFGESIFDELSVKFNRFWDSYESEENRFFAKPKLSFEINDTRIKTDFIVDYVGTKFKGAFDFGESLAFGFTNIGVHPSFNYQRDDWSINFGAAAFYSMDMENEDNKFFIYPQVNASLKLVGDLMIFYAGAEGTLEQNSYREFTNLNPYLAPFMGIAPTDRQYDIFAGLKGKLASSVSYNLRGSYVNERNRPMFISNPYTEDDTNENYGFGNSFGVVYDDMRTISFFGELKADFSKSVSFGINGTFSNYSVDEQAEAWNLPALRVGSSIDVDITPKWYAGAQVFFVGERKDFRDNLSVLESKNLVTLDAYFDANAHVGYKHNDRLTGFIRVNNIANQMYEKCLDYPVQGIQGIIGASYKFDF